MPRDDHVPEGVQFRIRAQRALMVACLAQDPSQSKQRGRSQSRVGGLGERAEGGRGTSEVPGPELMRLGHREER